jgi:Na+-translocating ferredoxin:NAD+ oxidoreductase subunit G
MRDVVRLGAILFLVCAVAAGSLAFFADITAKPIAEQARVEQQEALKRVAPDATAFTEIAPGKRWGATNSGATIGEVLAVDAKGYGGPIKMMVGLDASGRLTGVRVLSQTETPGLGNKISTDGFLAQFVGKTQAELRIKKDGGSIDAISAATISSRAVTNALRSATSGR